ncbi:MBL fold metallo-hydrolase [Salinarimonas ramus]|uniref:MBL fold metallo-hydrolase n=1 Tax=Salinarimonas ramus TaxID=690164 RepID=A0A917V2M2_9HYPH|nr:MBL fold metallo-hydrolase [Salinarimonas ramus]GGK29621.1 MBL fold metallo-hydrolase [Salinarimonas ramus]
MTSLSRRTLLGGLAAGAGLAAASPLSPARAQAPATALEPGAGAYRFNVGDIRVTVLGDGRLELGPVGDTVPGVDAETVAALFSENGLEAGPLATAANVVLIETGDRRILLDAGSGSGFQPTAGRLPASLAAAGVAPETIDTVVVTHVHPDHAWGLVDEAGAPVFGAAEHVIGEADLAFWTDPATRAAFPAAFHFLVDGNVRVLSAIEGSTTAAADGREVAPGVTLMATPGHTPGHMAVALSSGDAKLLVIGDVATHPIVSLSRPDWGFVFDADPQTAAATRKRVLDMAASDAWPVLAYHFPFPGVGRIVAAGEGYRSVPVML